MYLATRAPSDSTEDRRDRTVEMLLATAESISATQTETPGFGWPQPGIERISRPCHHLNLEGMSEGGSSDHRTYRLPTAVISSAHPRPRTGNMGDPTRPFWPPICRSPAASVGGLGRFRVAEPHMLLGFAPSKNSTTSGAIRGAEQPSMTTRLQADAHRRRRYDREAGR
jgi:hypothetical protein